LIEKPTVLVLGAGASIDFGFPSGNRLVRRIIEVGKAAMGGKPLLELGFTREQIDEFGEVLRQSGCLSVDEFLATRPDLVGIGKGAIACALIPFEQWDQVNTLDGAGWLQILATRMVASPETWHQNRLSIVTFNYDRVVEYFLCSALASRFRLTNAAALELMNRTVRIIHVHGKLGEFGHRDSDKHRTFESAVTASRVFVGAAGIKIIHEGAPGDQEFVEARQLISQAAEVVFMGFGYGRTNVERLKLDETLIGKSVLGSSVGMTARQRENANKAAGGHLALDPRGFGLSEFLNEHAVLGH
jgi:hypothetical protein